MWRPLSLDQIAEIILRHPSVLTIVAQQPVINVDSVAYAISCMAVDSEVARSVIAASTGDLRDDIKPGFLTLMHASAIAATTLRAHPHEQIAAIFYEAVAPDFGASTGTVQ